MACAQRVFQVNYAQNTQELPWRSVLWAQGFKINIGVLKQMKGGECKMNVDGCLLPKTVNSADEVTNQSFID